MPIKSTVALADSHDLSGVLNVAVALANRLAAYLQVLHIKRDPYDTIPIGIDGLSGDVIEEIANSARMAIEARRVRAKADYDRICAPSGQSVTWKEVVGRPSRMMAIASYFADLLALPPPDDNSPVDGHSTAGLHDALGTLRLAKNT